ncbi:MAG: FAD-dependent oxidoreductase [Alsobacter sp.]
MSFEGRVLAARRGESLAAALVAHGVLALRQTRGGSERGVFCGMGVCQECLVTIDGRANANACMTVVDRPMAVTRQVFPPVVSVASEPDVRDPPPLEDPGPDVLVVGGGAGGLAAAAVAAEAGARVLVVDERAKPGGQYFKQPAPGLEATVGVPDDVQFAGGRRLIARAREAGVRFVRGSVIGRDGDAGLLMLTDSGAVLRLTPRRLVVATGAYERPHPIPGWTLPGVMTTGAMQTLLRTDRVLPGKRILVAGNGPLNLQVALELARAGARAVTVAEAAPAPGPDRLAALAGMALSSPSLLARGAATVLGLLRQGSAVRWGAVVTRIEAGPDGLVATLSGPDGKDAVVSADAIGLGYGFLPAHDLLRLLHCPQIYDAGRDQLVTPRDADMRTGTAGIFAVGDCCGLGGAPAALAEGVVAGATAAGEVGFALPARLRSDLAKARRDLARHRRFQDALWRLFAAPPAGLALAGPDTIVCRCEDVTLDAIDRALCEGVADIGSLKRATRLGMGRCQGRYCGPLAVRHLADRRGAAVDAMSFLHPRPPIRPVRLGALAGVAEAAPTLDPDAHRPQPPKA